MNVHPTDAELRGFVRNAVPADRVVAMDDHLATCEECRRRAAQMGDVTARLSDMSTDLLDLEAHLSDDQIQRHASGDTLPAERLHVDRHLAECRMCAREVEELRSWIAARPHPRRRMYLVAAAAALLLLVIPLAISRRGQERAANVTAALPAPALPGFDLVPAGQRAAVTRALSEGAAEPPSSLKEMTGTREALMGLRPAKAAFDLISPLRTITISDRPDFRWTALPGVEDYTVAVLDSDLTVVAGPATVEGTDWTAAQPLTRGRSYVWQVTARRGNESVLVPAPPAPPARFAVMDAQTASMLERVADGAPESHVLLGILFAQAGARNEAEEHLQQVPATDPYAGVARRTLERLQVPR